MKLHLLYPSLVSYVYRVMDSCAHQSVVRVDPAVGGALGGAVA